MKNILPQDKENKDKSAVFAAAHVGAIKSHLKDAGLSPTSPKAPAIVAKAQAAAHRQIFGAPGVDEGTATMASRIESGEDVKKVKSQYTRIGSKNFPKNPVGNKAAAAYQRSVGNESDAGDMSNYDPTGGVKK